MSRPAASSPTRRAPGRSAPAVGGALGPVPFLVAVVVVLNLIGLVMVLSASSVVSIEVYGSAWRVFERQLMWTTVGGLAFVVASRLDYHIWQRWAVWITGVAALVCTVVLVPGIGIVAGGSRRWLGVGWFGFQPSELAKLALVCFAADLLDRRADAVGDWRSVLKPVLMVAVSLCGLVYLEPDLDTTVVLVLITASILVVGGVRLHHLGMLALVGVGTLMAAAVAEPYRRARVLTYLQAGGDTSNTGYQIVQSFIALGSGGITGVGLGAGRAKWHFLPNAHTDFVFSIIGEELGLIGCILVLVLFVAFAGLAVTIAMRASDRFGMLCATGIAVWVAAQAAINIGGVTGVIPVSGIPLPFVSFGGSSLVMTMLAAGIVVNIGRSAAGAPTAARRR